MIFQSTRLYYLVGKDLSARAGAAEVLPSHDRFLYHIYIYIYTYRCISFFVVRFFNRFGSFCVNYKMTRLVVFSILLLQRAGCMAW